VTVAELAASSRRVVAAAGSRGVDIQIRRFPEGTRTAEDAARAIGVQVGQIVKSLVFIADERPLLCLVSGSNRLDTGRLAATLDVTTVRRADANEVRETTGYAVGGVPPFGHDRELAIYCDRDLLQYEVVWAAAGTPDTVFAITPEALIDACGAHVADVKEG